jgi:hypothetical protein
MEIFNLDLVAVLIFVLPGYYFLLVSGLLPKHCFSMAVQSLFCGILIAFVLNYFYPVEKYTELLSNPLAGALILSLWGMVLGLGVRMVIDPIKRIFSRY